MLLQAINHAMLHSGNHLEVEEGVNRKELIFYLASTVLYTEAVSLRTLKHVKLT